MEDRQTEKEKWVDCTIIGKWIKKGWIWREQPQLSLDFGESYTPRFLDYPISMAQYNYFETGNEIRIKVFRHKDGFLYPYKED